MKTQIVLTALASVAALSVASGCGSKDTGQTNVKFDPGQSRQQAQQSIQEVQNNPNLSDAQKQQIISRIQGNAAAGAGSAAAQSTGATGAAQSSGGTGK